MPSYRVTYHTTGGPFSRVIEAKCAEIAEKAAIGALNTAVKAGSLLTFTEDNTRFNLVAMQVAAVTVEEANGPAQSGERRSAGFLGR